MKNSSFSCLRSINNQLHNKLSQESEYDSYLKRIDKIVDRKPFRDTSPQFYMKFLNKCRQVSRNHKESQNMMRVVSENQHLLNRIIELREKRSEPATPNYQLHMYEKRYREIEKINEENLKMARRITGQHSRIRCSMLAKETKSVTRNANLEKKTYAHWNYSPLRERKLPKLINSSKVTVQSLQNSVARE